MTDNFPAISIRQPWAELILRGRKTVELRTWSTEYRGKLWLHTGLKGDQVLEEKFSLTGLFKGGYLGTIVLTAIVPMDQQRWETWRDKHLDSGSYRSGMYAWVLSSPQRFKIPISGPGSLNLFSPSPTIETQLHEAAYI